ncbi:type I polyketide synthase [Sinorhizobium mexicanum]|uniref:SDR family NAD(P)-dependent oxidoreductase n=1 Tax=Sinorhizobium mexicanum TaxID=375549 RepID=A0A859QNT9_9HYPH|nr:type I polyketide synthase [Sinorhizobium mexicanum]MBP1888333.1 amino acid adenylation domain-containing protein [Sinorhizobium mexicanum]QLL64410.1 SDR family NAD(P)-dependent oxidoreductase [Sinorhizobium mexicanum]
MKHSLLETKTFLKVLKSSLEPSYRVFCFPHGGGGVHSFRDWSEYLPEDIELISLDLPGRGKRSAEAAIRRMDVLVSVFTEALHAYNDRPFIFFGHSMGALVAYEIARSLEVADRPSPFHLVVSGHEAADVPVDAPMYKYSDDKLADLVRTLGIVPTEALANEKLLVDFILPPLRADFELAETYDRNLVTPLKAAITAMGGVKDEMLNANDLDEWRRLTTSRFARIMFDGDHFFPHSMAEEVVSSLLREVSEVKAQLPASIHHGEVVPYTNLTLHEQFRRQAALTPDRPAIVSETATVTYRKLDDLSETLSRYLLGHGQGLGSRVGILMDTSSECAVAMFGILKTSAAYVMLDKALPMAALKRTLEKAGIEIVVTNNRFAAKLPPDWPGTALSLDEGWEAQLGRSSPVNPQAVDLDAPAQIVFSSGTTGEPKGVVSLHRSAVSSYQWRYSVLPYAPDERDSANLFLSGEIMRPILAGIPAYLIPDDIIYDPHQLVAYLERNRISRILLTPSLLDVLLSSGLLDVPSRLPDLRLIFLSGEVLMAALLARVRDALPHVRIINYYGASEAHDVTHIDLSEIDPVTMQKVVPVGPPQHNVSVYILGEQRDPVPLGFLGEVFVGGDVLAHGYLDSPEMTRERFFPDPFGADGKMFRTGDLGRMLPGGQLEIVGRCAFMVKIRGYSVVPGSVEAALLRHSDVCSAAVVPELDPTTGQPDKLIGYVVLRNWGEGWKASLRAHMKSEVPHYAVPTDFVALGELPIAENGKLDRSRLRELTEETSPPETLANEAESALRDAWRDLLQSDTPDPSDNFFDCGGHSLLAARLCTQVRERLKVELRAVEVFLNPTFKELAILLRKRRGEQRVHQNETLRKVLTVSAGKVPTKTFARRGGTAMDIAVIGMSGRFPGAETVDALWENLWQGVCSITPLSAQELKAQGIPQEVLKRSDYMRVGAHLADVDLFDPGFWGISMQEATLMDPQHRLFLECCWKALESAGYMPTQQEGRTGVFAGSYLPLYLLHHLRGGGLIDTTDAALSWLTELGNDKDYLATRVSYMLNLNGPSIAVQSACSTGLVAVAMAAQSLSAGYCDMALAGGASIIFPQAGYQHIEGFINSSDGLCRAFDADANGTVLGDGVGVVVLKRLEDALAAGDPIHAVVKGCAINNDGRAKSSFSAPSVQGQTTAVRQALASAALGPEDVEYIETHGTGTKVGDPIEIRALAEAYAGQEEMGKTCALGSIKPNIGHANVAAGVASFIKTVLCLQHGAIPPTININQLNKDLGLEDTPFFVNEQLRPWPRRQGRPRTAGVTSLGTGGTNCHVVLQEWTGENARDWPGSIARGSYALCLSAKTPSALSRACRNMAAFLRRNRHINLGDTAHTLRVARCHFDYRTVVVARNLDMAIKRLEEEADRPADRILSSPSVAFMLPGGGVQHVGMFKDLFDHVPNFREAFLTCAATSRQVLDRDLESLVFGGNDAYAAASFEEINVMIFSVQYAMARLLEACGVRPGYLVGHSMSEYVVATLAGILKPEDAIGLMVVRSRAMANLGIDGAMLAAKCSADEAEHILKKDAWRGQAEAGEISVGVVNSKSSVVFTGKRELLERLQQEFEKAEIPNHTLNTAGIPSHSPLMKPAADIIDAQVRTLQKRVPDLAIALNSGGYLHPAKVPLAETYWSRQAIGMIRFDRSLAATIAAGATALVELGPSRNLGRFAREATSPEDRETRIPAIVPAARDRNDEEFTDRHVLLECLGNLWALGVPVDWKRASDQLEPFGVRRRIPLPTYSFDRHRCWPQGQPAGLMALPQTGERERRTGEVFTYAQSWTEKMILRTIAGDGSTKQLRWLVLADQPSKNAKSAGDALAKSITRQLEDAGHEVVRVCRRTKPSNPSVDVEGSTIFIDPNREGLKALFDAEIASDCPADRILCLWHLSGCADACWDAGTVQTDLLRSYDAILDLARVLSKLTFQTTVDLWIVGDRTVQVGDEPVDSEKASVFGPALVLPQENPMVKCRVVDLNIDDANIGDRLVAEIGRDVPGPDAVIALRGKRRWVPYFPEMILAAQAPEGEVLKPEGVYLITGALGRIGMSLTEHLVTLGATVVGITRRVVPDSLDWNRADLDEHDWMRRLAALDTAMGRVIIRQVDVSDFDGLSSVLDSMVREFGRIDGIFHAAGLGGAKFLSEMEDTTSAGEFASKIAGTRNLYAAIERMQSTRAQTPEFVFLFSSLASILGGPAMTAYAAANRFMDAFARQVQDKLGVRWINSNWDDWDYSHEWQVTASCEKSRAKHLALSADEGIGIIKRILATVDNGQVIVATSPLPPRLKQWVDQVRAITSDEPGGEKTSPSEEARQNEEGVLSGGDLRNVFLDEVKSLLNVTDIGLDDNFFDVGGDSLLAAALQLRLKNSPHWKPPRLDEIFKASTFGDLYQRICHT